MLEMLTAVNLLPIEFGESPADQVFDPPLKALLILPDATGGDLIFDNEIGTTLTVPVDATVTHPIYLPGRVRRIDKDTTMDPEYIFGVR